MTKTSFLDWMREKLSFGSKRKFAGATVEDGYFHYETFKGNQLKAKSSDDLDQNDLYGNNKTRKYSKEDKLNEESFDDGGAKNDSNRNSGTFGYRYSKKKEHKKRMTVIPTVGDSSAEKSASSRDRSLKRSNIKLRFSFVGTLRRRFRKESFSSNDIRTSKVPENPQSVEDYSTPNIRSKRILSAPSLKSYGGKSNIDDIRHCSFPGGNSQEGETSNNSFSNSFNVTNPSWIQESYKTSIEVASPAEDFCIPNSCQKETPKRNNTISLKKVSGFFPSPPCTDTKSSVLETATMTIPSSTDNDYIGFNVSRNKPSQKIPTSPNHRNSDPYVNLQFHKFNLYGGSQESMKEDNYCLRPDDYIPAVPPRTYKKDLPSSNFSRYTRSYQSFSSFSTLAVSNNNINKTLQQLPKSVALKCEAFCKRVDALSSDYLPMNMHPLSNKLSDN